MNKSPDRFEIELEREIALERAREAPSDPELAADWALKQELRSLGTDPGAGSGAAELPSDVIARARRAIGAERRSPWAVAVAAAVFAAIVATLVVQVPVPSQRIARPSETDMADLRLALDTLSATGRRAAALAGREVSESLEVPDLGLAELPYADYVRPYFKRSKDS